MLLLSLFCICLVNQNVNQPQFASFIGIYNATSNTSIYKINVQVNTAENVTYSNNTLIFDEPETIKFTVNDEFYITFDEGVLFSNSTSNSTAQTAPDFWYLRVISLETTTSVTTISEGTSTETSYDKVTNSLMISSVDSSTLNMTTETTVYRDSTSQTANYSNTASTSPEQIIKGIIEIYCYEKNVK